MESTQAYVKVVQAQIENFVPILPSSLDHFNWASFRRSSHFFISGNNPIAKLPEYLETMLGKMAKEMPGINTKQEVLGSQDEEVIFLDSKCQLTFIFGDL